MEQLSRKFQIILELSIWSCITLIPLMNTKSLEIVFWLLLLSFIFNPKKMKIIEENILFFVLMLQYPILNIIRIYFTPTHKFEIISSPAEYEIWIYCIVGAFLATDFFARQSTIKFAKIFLPLSILLVFLVGAINFFFLDDQKSKFWNENVFEAPLFATTLAFILVGINKTKIDKQIALTWGLIGSTILLSMIYAGSRGIFIGQIASLMTIFFLLLYLKRYSLAITVFSTVVLFSSVGVLIDSQYNKLFLGRFDIVFEILNAYQSKLTTLAFLCGLILLVVYFLRINLRFKYYHFMTASLTLFLGYYYMSDSGIFSNIRIILLEGKEIADQIDPSTSYRMQFYIKGLNALDGHFLTGLGAYIEPYLAQAAFTGSMHLHLHNNYLSWLIWGGVLTIISGLLWLFAPTIILARQKGFYSIIPCLMISVLWSVSLLFDSFFSWKNFTYVYLILICLSYQNSKLRDSA